MKLRLTYIAVILCMMCSISLHAQNQSDIEAAKAMAKTLGYTEAEIEAMLATQKGGINTQGKENDPTKTLLLPGKDVNQDVPVEVIPAEEPKDSCNIYGHAFFASKGFGVVSGLGAPAPESYVLGPGDEVTIHIWGSTNAMIHDTIGKDGTIMINNLGPVTLSGLTVTNAETALRKRLTKIYSGLGASDTNLKLSIGRVKSMTINVTGDVVSPGAYGLPGMATIPTAIFQAGGVTETASVRNIRLYRKSKLIGVFDLYDFIFNGAYSDKLKLQDNDIIYVASYETVVTLDGAVRRPMGYEMTREETLVDLIRYAGGFADNADKDGIHIERTVSGTAMEVPASRFATFTLEPSDTVRVRSRIVEFTNRINIEGAVNRPGAYSINDEIKTVKDLIEKAGGLADGASQVSGVIHRLNRELNPASVTFSIKDVLEGTISVPLAREDSVFIYFGKDITEPTYVTLYGEVSEEGRIDYREGMTINEAIIAAGGYKVGADLSFIEVASRGNARERSKVATYNLIDHPEDGNTVLKPRDMVFIKKQENFRKIQTIDVKGEVAFPGMYAIDKSTVRLSDVLSRAGGFTDAAYVKGASLKRTITEEESARFEIALGIAEQLTENSTKDSVNFVTPDETYTIGIDLEKALENPGSEFDVILRTGDIITVPQMDNTVRISGAVFYPNVVVYNPKYTLRDYISQAGGKLNTAKSNHIYAVYMSGMVAKKGSPEFKMEPGMEIVVPKEIKAERKITPAESAAIASSSTSIAYMAASLVRMIL